MSFLFDFFPILLFFISFKIWGIYAATAIAIAATFIQLILAKVIFGVIKRSYWISFFTVFILGGATLILQNEMIIKWKPTVVYLLLALAMLLSPVVSEKTLLQHLGGDLEKSGLSLSNSAWKKLNWSWAIFCVLMGVANLYVVYNYDTNTWNNFKFFGILGCTLIFVFIQAILMARWSKPNKSEGPAS